MINGGSVLVFGVCNGSKEYGILGYLDNEKEILIEYIKLMFFKLFRMCNVLVF